MGSARAVLLVLLALIALKVWEPSVADEIGGGGEAPPAPSDASEAPSP
jgi:hypothetical protein